MNTHSDRKSHASFPRHRRRLRSCRERTAQKEEEWNEGVRTETRGVPGSVGGQPQGAAVREALWRSSAAPGVWTALPPRPHSPEAVLLHGAPGPRTWGRREDGRLEPQQEAGRSGPTAGVACAFPGVTLGLTPEELFLPAVLEAEAAWPQDSVSPWGPLFRPPPHSC